jgi:cell division protein FtsI (penicillin-binding protein 3)
LIEITPDQLEQLARLLHMEKSEIERRIYRKKGRFVYLKRWIVPEVAERIADLKIKGIAFETEFKRYYPEGEVAAHIVGFTDIEDRGQEGVEHGWNAVLTGEIGSRRVIKDNKGRIIEDVEKNSAHRASGTEACGYYASGDSRQYCCARCAKRRSAGAVQFSRL